MGRGAGTVMRVKIIGSAAGGGFPQWNCNYRLSRAARTGMSSVHTRTQSCIAASADGTGWIVAAFPDRGKIALYLEQKGDPSVDFRSDTGDTIGVRMTGTGSRDAVFYIPGCARIDASLRTRLANAACLLFDGTVYTDDEMIIARVGQKTGAR